MAGNWFFFTLEATGVGWRMTRPSSLSSRANLPSASAYSFIFTKGSGCVVVKSPWVSHLDHQSALASFINQHLGLLAPVAVHRWRSGRAHPSRFPSLPSPLHRHLNDDWLRFDCNSCRLMVEPDGGFHNTVSAAAHRWHCPHATRRPARSIPVIFITPVWSIHAPLITMSPAGRQSINCFKWQRADGAPHLMRLNTESIGEILIDAFIGRFGSWSHDAFIPPIPKVAGDDS